MSETGEAVIEKQVREDYALAKKARMVEATLVAGTSSSDQAATDHFLAFYRRMAMQAFIISMKEASSEKLLVGHMFGVSFTIFIKPMFLLLPRKLSSELVRFTPSNKKFVASLPNIGTFFGKREHDLCSKPSILGSNNSFTAC